MPMKIYEISVLSNVLPYVFHFVFVILCFFNFHFQEEFDREMELKCQTVHDILKRLDLPPVLPIERFCTGSTNSISLPYNMNTLREIEVFW